MNQRLNKFLQDTAESKLPLSIDLWKQGFEIADLSGVESKEFDGFKQKIPNKLRLPAKKFIKGWLQKNEEKEVMFPPLAQFLRSLEVDDDLNGLIWIEFKSGNIKKTEQLFRDYLQYFQDEIPEHLNTLNKLFQNYHHKNNIQEPDPNSSNLYPDLNVIQKQSDQQQNIQEQIEQDFNEVEKEGKNTEQSQAYWPNNDQNLLDGFRNPNQIDDQLKKQKKESQTKIQEKKRGKNEENKNMTPKQQSAADYIIDSLKQKKIWGFEQKSDQQAFVRELKKSPQLFDDIIQKWLGRSGPYGKFLKQMKEDNFLKNLILKSKKYPFHKVYQSISRWSARDSILFNLKVQIKCWEIDPILKETNFIFRKFILDLIEQEKDNMESILISMSELIFDVLIRKADLPMRINQINKIGVETNHELLKSISVYDFVTVFSKIVQKSKLPYFGLLLHKNCLPIPVISCTLNEGSRKYYSRISLLQNILIDKKVKLVVNAGTAMSERKGKTELIAKALGIDYKHCSFLECDFHIGCVSFYTNLSSMTADQPVIIADIHGQINENLKQKSIKRIFANANLIILQTHPKDQPDLKNILKFLSKYTKARFLITVRDSSENIVQQDGKICLPKIKQKSQPQKHNIYNKFRAILISEIKKNNLTLDYKNLVEQQQKVIIQKEEQMENKIVKMMKEAALKQGELWKKCFPNLNQFRDLYKMELKIYELEGYIKYDKRDERHKEYLERKNNFQEKKKKFSSDKHSITSVAEIYFKNYKNINTKTLNSKITEWKKEFTEKLQKQIVDLRAKFEKKEGDPQKLIKTIDEKEYILSQFDVSADTILQEVLIVANYQQQIYSGYKNCLSHYYSKLYETQSPINLIDGNTLLFGNPFLKTFFEEISIPKHKKVFVVSVIGIQSSAKSTLMNYLFNCRFETSAGRCTKGAYFTISQTQKQVFVVVDTQGLMSVCARDRVFDIQIASFTFLTSDLIIINNKGQINTPIRELLGVCTYALQELNQRKKGRPKSKVFFAIRDQLGAGVQKQKKMLADIINALKSHSDLADFEDFLDFSSEDIYPLESAFNQIPTSMNTTIQKPNYCFSEQIIALRSKIIMFLNSKGREPLFTDIKDFYNESEKKWASIRECGEHIFNFQEVLEIKIKNQLKQYQQQILNVQFQEIEALIQQSVHQMERINNNDKLRSYQEMIEGKINKSFQIVKQQMTIYGKSIKGVKSEWIKDLIQDSFRQFNYKTIMNREYIENLYKQRMKVIKEKDFKQKISQIISSILKTDRELYSIKNQYENQCKKLLQQEEFKFDDTPLTLRAIIQKEVQQNINIKIRKSSVAQYAEKKFSYYFIATQIAIYPQEKLQAVQIVQLKLNNLQSQIKIMNKRHEPITGQNNKKFIQEYELKVNQMIQLIEKDVQRLTRNWKIFNLKLEQTNFKSEAFWLFCQTVSNVIERNRFQVKKRINRQRNEQINNKWKQIQKNFKIKGDAEMVAKSIIQQLEVSIMNQIYADCKKQLMKGIGTLVNKFDPVKMINEVMRLTFNSWQYGKTTWLKCFKVIYNFNRFMQEQILYTQSQYLQLSNNVKIQKDNAQLAIAKMLSQIADRLDDKIDDFQKLGEFFKIDVKSFQYAENRAIFDLIHMKIKNQLEGSKLQQIKHKLRSKVYKQDSIFKNLEKQLQDFVKDNIAPQIIGCQQRCPYCSMKCKLTRGHQNGHICVKGTHLQQCFGGVRQIRTHKRSKTICFTEYQIKESGYYRGGDDQKNYLPTLKDVEKYDPQWLDHFKSGPYQDKLNELNCQRIWANIGDVLIKTKYKHKQIINVGVRSEYIQNPLCEEDVKSWIK